VSATEGEVRQWGIGLGLPVAARGKLPHGLVERWNREHPDRPFMDTRASPYPPPMKFGGEAADYRARGRFTPERAAAAARRRGP
jgi:hypothetical protein